jgi:hypothetical protein
VNIISQRDQQQGTQQPAPPTLESLRCSFCGKPRRQVRSIVCGPTPEVAICDECVELCSGIIAEELRPTCGGEPPVA